MYFAQKMRRNETFMVYLDITRLCILKNWSYDMSSVYYLKLVLDFTIHNRCYVISIIYYIIAVMIRNKNDLLQA